MMRTKTLSKSSKQIKAQMEIVLKGTALISTQSSDHNPNTYCGEQLALNNFYFYIYKK